MGEVGPAAVTLAPGVRVEVILGMAVGRRGVILGPWPRHYAKGIALWRVGFQGELIRDRILREDYLRPIGETPDPGNVRKM